MNVYKNLQELPAFPNAVITIGTFDGVHQGHMQIIRQLKEAAARVNGTAVVITFDPHPKQVVASDKKPIFILNTPSEKYELLHKNGIGHIVVVPFDTDFANQPALGYIRNFLVGRFHPHTIIIGYDHRFGKNREGDYRLLENEATTGNFTVQEIPPHVLQDVTISSTRIREALLAGDVETAEQFLGYPYFFSGMVMEGKKLGRTIGYPTANVSIADREKLVPGDGVYAVSAEIEGKTGLFPGMMNIGYRPTVDGKHRTIEVHLFDFTDDIYGKKMTIVLRKRLRDEIKFSNLDALKEQLARDAAAAR